jgi:hypothetical protein
MFQLRLESLFLHDNGTFFNQDHIEAALILECWGDRLRRIFRPLKGHLFPVCILYWIFPRAKYIMKVAICCRGIITVIVIDEYMYNVHYVYYDILQAKVKRERFLYSYLTLSTKTGSSFIMSSCPHADDPTRLL